MGGTFNYHSAQQKLSKQTDSIFGNFDQSQLSKHQSPQKRESIFTEHRTVNHQTYIQKQRNSFEPVFYILSGELILIIILLAFNRKLLLETLGAFFSAKSYQQRERKKVIADLRLLPLFILFILNISIFTEVHFPSLSQTGTAFNILYGIGKLALAFTGFYLAKIILVYLSGWIFHVPDMGQVYNDYIFLSIINFGLFLSFFLWFDIYAANAQIGHFSLIIFGLFSLFRVLRTYSLIIPKSDFSVLHFFLYLCTVEILPLIVLGKLVEQGI
jgi:hypothetical protein